MQHVVQSGPPSMATGATVRQLKLTSFPVTLARVGEAQALIAEDWAEIRRLRRSEGVLICDRIF